MAEDEVKDVRDQLNRDVFYVVSRYINRPATTENSKSTFVWGTIVTAANRKTLTQTFVDLFVSGKAEFAVIPDVDKSDWDEEAIQKVLESFQEFQIVSKSFEDGAGVVRLRCLDFEFNVKFVKKTVRYATTFLTDDLGQSVNSRYWKLSRLFIYKVFKSSQSFANLRLAEEKNKSEKKKRSRKIKH